jgi:hypothetical protein
LPNGSVWIFVPIIDQIRPILTPNVMSPGNTTNNLWVLDLTLDLLGTHQAKLQLIITLLL